MPPSYNVPAREKSMISTTKNNILRDESTSTRRVLTAKYRGSSVSESYIELSAIDPKISEGYVFKGIVAAEPAEPRLCGCIQPPPIADAVAPYSSIENISIQKLTPEYKVSMERLVTTKSPPMKASELWHDKPAVVLCVRRPG